MKKETFTKKLLFFLIFILAFFLRIYGINWDRGFHLHPDERMLIMVAERIHFFNNLNPNFFNYGSLPIYLLKGVSQLIEKFLPFPLSNYQEMVYVGRILSVIFDLTTLFLIFKICQKLDFFSKKNPKGLNINQPLGFNSFKPLEFFSLTATFFYAISFFPIQNSHFFIVDVFLTTFTTFLFYLLLNYLKEKNSKKLTGLTLFIGITMAAIVSTKFTGVIFFPFIWLIMICKWLNSKGLNRNQPLGLFFIFNFSFLIFNFLFMPYAFLDYKKFLSDISLQIKMNNNPYIFPYTLQYVNTPPYFYYLKNIFLWGVGPFVFLLSFLGLIFLFKNKFLNPKKRKFFKNYSPLFLLFLFYSFYFLIIGRSAVKFMRYMLPIYPFLAIMAGYGFYQLKNLKFKIQNYNSKLKIINFKFLSFLLICLSVFWTLCFINIYSQPHTRIVATEWILKNIPAGSTLAIEHWDDRLPLFGEEKYNFVELNLYDQPDNDWKWSLINQKLTKTDYIIIASNRLYIPLQKLEDCKKYKICYPKTASYYKKLFSETLGFRKIAEFAVYPYFQIGNFKIIINDQNSDESFTVYDHPKIMIFKKQPLQYKTPLFH